MNSNHNILPNLPLKQAKNNLASQLACRKTTTAWKTLNIICTCFWLIRNISLLYKRESYELTITKRLSRTMIMDVRLMCTSSLECKTFLKLQRWFIKAYMHVGNNWEMFNYINQ